MFFSGLVSDTWDFALFHQKEMNDQRNTEKFVGVVEVHIHQARDIHNICIYQNQDVYVKFYLTDNTENKISSQVINRGGKNPVFDETLKVPIRTTDSSLRCEVWMLSRIRNYLEDQLLGFVLIPLSDVLFENKNESRIREFALSSSEIFHCPAGSVELSFKHTGTSPDIMEIRVSIDDRTNNVVSCELGKIEFPDQGIVKENECMVSQYLTSLENDDDQGDDIVVPTTVVTSPSDVGKSENVSIGENSGGEVVSRSATSSNAEEAVEKLVSEEIVDMYMKGMQEFTDALEKMKLPMDKQEGKTAEESKNSVDPGQRVFYGSRAFF